jgi:methionyl-tRNA formyltransferase
MMKPVADLKIVFFGTPDFAVASLRALVEAGMNVAAVVTAPDKPSGRGLQLHTTPVKQYAESQNIPVLQPEKLKNPDFIAQLRSYHADIHIVVAFRMLPVLVWDMPPMGTINVHGSLLPQYRGAAPINWAIINGATETGVTTFKLKHEIDTGDILLQSKINIGIDDNAGTVHDKLMLAGAELLVKTIKGLAEGSIVEQPQSAFTGVLQHAPKLFKEDMRIDWHRPAVDILNHIRGLSPYPAAFTELTGKVIKIYKGHIVQEAHTLEAGLYDTDHKHFLRIATNDAWIYVDELQQEGKKRMDIEAFLRGFRA